MEEETKYEEPNIEQQSTRQLSPKQINLELGDIIKINSPTNPNYNSKIFYIDYIDNTVIQIISSEDLNTYSLNIEDDDLTDKSILSIDIVMKSPEKGYARQNNLLPGQWIDIHFNGDLPIILTGIITDLEKDQIEINLYPNNEKIYINFGYKGLPKDIPIKQINTRDEPTTISKIPEESKEDIDDDEKDDALNVTVPILQLKQKIQDVIAQGDMEVVDLDLDFITQTEIVDTKNQRYSIDSQVDDLLNELISKIPYNKRTKTTIQKIHTVITRFLQLRNNFSEFDENGIITGTKKKGATYRPSVENIIKMKTSLPWLLPVVKNVLSREDLYSNYETLEDFVNLIDDFKNDNLPVKEDKIDYFLSKIDEFYNINIDDKYDPNTLLSNQPTNTDIDTISQYQLYKEDNSTSDNDYKFNSIIIDRYNLGFNKLKVETIKNKIISSEIVNATKNETVPISSILILPESFLRTSAVKLPSTNIYQKAHLNSIPNTYFQLFNTNKQDSKINVGKIKNIQLDDVDENSILPEKIRDALFKDIYNFSLNESIQDEDKYRKFLNIVIPKTKTIFNIVKKYITYNTSFENILSYLEPFLIYRDDLTFMQYNDIKEYITENITNLYKNIANNEIKINILRNIVVPKVFTSKLVFDLFETLEQNIVTNYNIHNTNITSSELYSHIYSIDNAKYFHNLLSSLNISLYNNTDIEEVIRNIKSMNTSLEQEQQKQIEKCKNINIAKKYINYEELKFDIENAIDGNIYYDKEYDPTNYDILESVDLEKEEMEEDEFKNFLENKLIQEVGLKGDILETELDALLTGARKVNNGDYAIVLIDEDDSSESVSNNYKIFKYEIEGARGDWVYDVELDKSIQGITIEKLQEHLCNREPLKVNEELFDMNIDMEKSGIETKQYDKLVKQFDEYSTKSSINIKSTIDLQVQQSLEDLINHIQYNKVKKLQHNNKQYTIGLEQAKDIESVIPISPYIEILNRVMSVSSIQDRYTYLRKFINEYTREYLQHKEEDPYWYYCIKTSTKLIPTFYNDLIDGFMNGNYQDVLDNIKKTRGKLSDDGSSWVDVHSGYVISNIDYVVEETYTSEGYKDINYEELQEEPQLQTVVKDDELVLDKEGKMIRNITNALITKSGINNTTIQNFIIRGVIKYRNKIILSKENYDIKNEEKIRKGKKVTSYDLHRNFYIIILVAIYFLVAAQTTIPNSRITKPMAGCISSLDGYPVFSESEYSGLNYVICVIKKIATAEAPWNSVKRIKVESIMKSIQSIYNSILFKDDDIKAAIISKNEYLASSKDEQSYSYDIKHWYTFMPPLKTYKLGPIKNITSEFKSSLMRNISAGSREQREKLNIIKSKIILYTLQIQKLIENKVNKMESLLTTKQNIPFVENFCCNDDNTSTVLEYFAKDEPLILEYNNTIKSLSNMYNLIDNYSKSSILMSNNDTKLKYPSVNKDFDETTIYQAFIEFCKINKNIPINPKLQPFCLNNTSAFTITDTIKEKVEILKSEGKQYDLAMFKQLLNIVNKENIIRLQIDKQSHNARTIFEGIIAMLIEKNSKLSYQFVEYLPDIIDNFDTVKEDIDSSIYNKLFSKVLGNIELYKKNISNTLDNFNINKNKRRKLKQFIETLENFNIIEVDGLITNKEETDLKSIHFLKTAIYNMIHVYPYMIINKTYNIDIENNKLFIPRYNQLSRSHINNLNTEFSKYFELFSSNNNFTSKHLQYIKDELDDISLLAENTPLYPDIYENGEKIESIFSINNVKQLYLYYFYRTLNAYITILDMPEPDIQYKIDDIVEADGANSKYDIVGKLLVTYLSVFDKEKYIIDLNRNDILSKVTNTKEIEKTLMVDRLTTMTQEQRNADNQLRSAGLGRWNIAIQAGLTRYDAQVYDTEVAEYQYKMTDYQDNDEALQPGYDYANDHDMAFVPDDDGDGYEDYDDAMNRNYNDDI